MLAVGAEMGIASNLVMLNLHQLKLNPNSTEPLAVFLLLETDNLGVIH